MPGDETRAETAAPATGAEHSYAAEAATIRQAIAVVERYRGGWYTLLADLGNLAAALDTAAKVAEE